MQNKPFVSVVICTQNRQAALKKYVLPSLVTLNYSNHEVIIVDDASKENINDTIALYGRQIKNLKFFRINKSKGLCYARNHSVEHCSGEIIAFIDDDCVVDKEWLNSMIGPYLADKNVMCVGGAVYLRDTSKLTHPEGVIVGTNMSFRKTVFEGFLFDTNFFKYHPAYYDEIDLIERMKGKDLKTVYTSAAIVHHFLEPAGYRKTLYQSLSALYFYAKRTSLPKYYFEILIHPLYHFLSKISPELFKKKDEHRSQIYDNWYNVYCSLLSEYCPKKKLLIKIIYCVYLAAIEIPIKAKIKHWIETERSVKFYVK